MQACRLSFLITQHGYNAQDVLTGIKMRTKGEKGGRRKRRKQKTEELRHLMKKFSNQELSHSFAIGVVMQERI